MRNKIDFLTYNQMKSSKLFCTKSAGANPISPSLKIYKSSFCAQSRFSGSKIAADSRPKIHPVPFFVILERAAVLKTFLRIQSSAFKRVVEEPSIVNCLLSKYLSFSSVSQFLLTKFFYNIYVVETTILLLKV